MITSRRNMMIMVLMVVIVMMARPLSQNAKRSKLEHLKAADDECEGFWLAGSHDLATLHCEVVLLLSGLRLHRLHRPEARETSVGEEDEISLPPCLDVLTPLVQPALLHHLHSEYARGGSYWSKSKYQTEIKSFLYLSLQVFPVHVLLLLLSYFCTATGNGPITINIKLDNGRRHFRGTPLVKVVLFTFGGSHCYIQDSWRLRPTCRMLHKICCITQDLIQTSIHLEHRTN